MSFDPKKFIDISEELKSGHTEAHYRSIINRAYYGAFGHIRNNLETSDSGLSVHQMVIKTLTCSDDTSKKKAGKKLGTLFKRRKDADYDYKKEIKVHECKHCIKTAREVIKLFDS